MATGVRHTSATKVKFDACGVRRGKRTADRIRMRDLHHSRAGGGSMKRQAFSLVSLLSLLLVAGSAIAQTVHVRADIPFNFAVGNKTYPAGKYTIRTIGDRSNEVLCLRAGDGNASMMILSNATESLTPADKTKLV